MLVNQIIAADFSLGRCNVDDLPQQTLMELFTADISGADRLFIGRASRSDDCCTWRGVSCRNKCVVGISWISVFGQKGCQLNLEYIPPSLQRLDLSSNGFKGTLNVSALPRSICEFQCNDNCIEGSLDLADLPPGTERVWLGTNELHGSIDLTNLPGRIQELLLFENAFTGTVDLSRLPNSLFELSVAHNQLSGSISLANLPVNIERLNLAENHFRGNIGFVNIPIVLNTLSMQGNYFDGDVNLSGFPVEMEIALNLSRNKFTGSVTAVHGMHAVVNLTGNDIASIVDADGQPCRVLSMYL